jgi:hypothetical protein
MRDLLPQVWAHNNPLSHAEYHTEHLLQVGMRVSSVEFPSLHLFFLSRAIFCLMQLVASYHAEHLKLQSRQVVYEANCSLGK